MTDDDMALPEEASYKSRSRKKRESTQLQQRGEELAALGPARWKELPLSPDIAEALAALRGMKTREAVRRHMQYIGRLMRELDERGGAAPLLEALDALSRSSAQDAAETHRLETLREALLSREREEREAAFEKALAACDALERSRLRHLVEAALAEREKQRPPRHARELFRYLRESGAARPGSCL